MAGLVSASGKPDEGRCAAIANGEFARSQDRLDEQFQALLKAANLS
jgi:hypothetical protein